MADSIPSRASVGRKAPKFIASRAEATLTNVQEFMSQEYGAAMRRYSKSASAADIGDGWATLCDWLIEALAERGVVVNRME